MVTGGEMTEAMARALHESPHLGGVLQNILPVPMLDPVDVSQAVVYLASDESRYMTSHEFTIDAGASQY